MNTREIDIINSWMWEWLESWGIEEISYSEDATSMLVKYNWEIIILLNKTFSECESMREWCLEIRKKIRQELDRINIT
jgi:hypothetical protein